MGAQVKDNAGDQTPARCGKASTKESATDKTQTWQQLEQLRSCTCEVQQRQVSRQRVVEARTLNYKMSLYFLMFVSRLSSFNFGLCDVVQKVQVTGFTL